MTPREPLEAHDAHIEINTIPRGILERIALGTSLGIGFTIGTAAAITAGILAAKVFAAVGL